MSLSDPASRPVGIALLVRSALFNVVFYANLVAFLTGGFFFLFTPRSWSMAALKTWSRVTLWWLEAIAGIAMEVRGRRYIPEGAALVAGKHQSLWETFALLPLFADPAVVLKRELTWIPLFGWFAVKFKMIPVDRKAGASALRRLTRAAREAAAMNRQILIFPEGTRSAPGTTGDYKPGAAALYRALDLPCVPFGLNSGLHWPRRKFLRYPGTIVVEFRPPIAPGLDRRAFTARLREEIETTTRRLEAEDTDHSVKSVATPGI